MTEKSYLWTTGSSGDGAATYSREDWQQITQIFASCHGSEGVAPSFRNALAGTANPGSSSDRTVRIASGGAIVDGKPYDSNANVDVVLDATPSLRRDRIVLRADWTAQTVRIHVIKGMDGSDTAPAITQTTQDVYDVTLYQAALTSGGTVTLTDERVLAQIGAADIVSTAMIPIGCIMLWSGSSSSIPTGWHLCDGTSGTPDLRDKFVVGAGSTYSVGANGGSATKNLAHTHTQGNTGYESSHTHLVSGYTGNNSTSVGVTMGTGTLVYLPEHPHTHQVSITSGSGSVHNHTNPTTSSALSTTQDIMPPYYALCYIMKVS